MLPGSTLSNMITHNPVGVIYFSLGCHPEVKKRETRFGVIFDGEAENHDKTKNAAYQIHPVEFEIIPQDKQNYNQIKHAWRHVCTQKNDDLQTP